jgi:hypothetical protein
MVVIAPGLFTMGAADLRMYRLIELNSNTDRFQYQVARPGPADDRCEVRGTGRHDER